jgi:hypothetical protein
VQYVDGVLLSPEELAIAAVLARLGVAHLERKNGGAPPAAIRLRDQLAAFAARETASVQASATRENTKALTAAGAALSAGETRVSAAAAQLGVSLQTVRSMCRRGALVAVRTVHGWQIDAGSLAEAAQRRKADDVDVE